MSAGQVSNRNNKKNQRLDPEMHEKLKADSREYYRKNKDKVLARKKELYDMRMATLISSTPQYDFGCHTMYRNHGD